MRWLGRGAEHNRGRRERLTLRRHGQQSEWHNPRAFINAKVVAFNALEPTDLRNQPAYTIAEAARYLRVAPATLRSWV